MSDIERKIRETLDRVAATSTAPSRLHEIASARRRRLPTPALAIIAFAVVVSVGVASLLLDSGPERLGVGAGTTLPVDEPDETVSLLPGVEVEVSNAVAPFDSESFVDSLMLEFGLARVRNGQVLDCLAAEGFTPPAMSELPDRDDPLVWHNPRFPRIEALARDGLPTLAGTPGSLDDTTEPSGEERAASRRCAEQVDGQESAVNTALGLWAGVRGAWEAVLDEIEATDEVRGLNDEFGACLRDEGIPAESTTSEGAFLGYVQSLLMATGTDEGAWPEINERMGKLFVQCGRELFETRERLRGGERREAFLREHEQAIRELSELLYGGGSSP